LLSLVNFVSLAHVLIFCVVVLLALSLVNKAMKPIVELFSTDKSPVAKADDWREANRLVVRHFIECPAADRNNFERSFPGEIIRNQVVNLFALHLHFPHEKARPAILLRRALAFGSLARKPVIRFEAYARLRKARLRLSPVSQLFQRVTGERQRCKCAPCVHFTLAPAV
jgi:hypothetical protein